RKEHVLELPPSIITDIQIELDTMGDQLRVTPYDDFVLFPHPADPTGKSPPDWCLAEGE
ncbi:hypothetical protein MNBD_ALPHA06-936, partial [hydrothermal vent metagenome]